MKYERYRIPNREPVTAAFSEAFFTHLAHVMYALVTRECTVHVTHDIFLPFNMLSIVNLSITYC